MTCPICMANANIDAQAKAQGVCDHHSPSMAEVHNDTVMSVDAAFGRLEVKIDKLTETVNDLADRICMMYGVAIRNDCDKPEVQQHNFSPSGKGIQITPDALNIRADINIEPEPTPEDKEWQALCDEMLHMAIGHDNPEHFITAWCGSRLIKYIRARELAKERK